MKTQSNGNKQNFSYVFAYLHKKKKDKKSSICFDQCDSFNLLLNFIRKHNLTKKRNQFLLCLNRNYEEENN